MTSEKTLQRATGVEWLPNGDGRVFPRYRWKSIAFDGTLRFSEGFYPGEREAVLSYFSIRISEYMFGTPCRITVEHEDRPTDIQPNPLWDNLPVLLTDPETGAEVLSDS